jgi:hypothetical protein
MDDSAQPVCKILPLDVEKSSFESTDQGMDLALNEEGQILVSKEEMAAWVKEVSLCQKGVIIISR